MLDLQFICDNPERVAENLSNRGVEVDLASLISGRKLRSELISQVEQIRREQNDISSRIPKEQDAIQKQQLIARGKELRQSVGDVEARLKEVEEQLFGLQKRLPNMTHPEAPVGSQESDSRVVRRWGEAKPLPFPALDHVALAEKHDLIDLEGGARVAGHGFYFLKNEAVLLE